MAGTVLDHAELAQHGLPVLALHEGVGEPEDPVEGAAELVREHAHEDGPLLLHELEVRDLGEVLPDRHEACWVALRV